MEFIEKQKITPEERRRNRISQLKEAIQKMGEVWLDDLYSEVSLLWGVRRNVFDSYIEALSKYVTIEKGKAIYKGVKNDEMP